MEKNERLTPVSILFLASLILLASCDVDQENQISGALPTDETDIELSEAEYARLRSLLSSDNPQTCHLRLDGEITQDKAEELADRIRYFADSGLGGRSGELSAQLCLDSPGGQLASARIIRDAFAYARSRDFGVRTIVKGRDECLSACALLFMSGFDCFRQACRSERLMSRSAKLGFHTPFFGIESLEGGDRFLASAYESAILDLGQFLVLGRDSVIPSFLIAEILRTPKDSFFLIDTVGKALAADIEVYDVPNFNRSSNAILFLCANSHALASGIENTAYTDYLFALRIGTEELPYGTSFSEFEVDGFGFDDIVQLAGSILSFSDADLVRPPDFLYLPEFQNDFDTPEPLLLVHYPTYAWDLNLIYTCTFTFRAGGEESALNIYAGIDEPFGITLPDELYGPARGGDDELVQGRLLTQRRANSVLAGWLAEQQDLWLQTWPPQTFLTSLN